MTRRTAKEWAGLLLLLLAGCAARADYRHVGRVHAYGDAHVLEHGQQKELEVALVMFTSGLGWVDRYLVETVPSTHDERAVRNMIEATPAYRRQRNLLRAIELTTAGEGYPWRGQLHWIVGTEPLVIAIGGPQGEEAARRGRERNSQYPLVGSVDLGETVNRLLVFQGGPKALRARRAADLSKVPREVVELADPTSLGDVLRTRADGATAGAVRQPSR